MILTIKDFIEFDFIPWYNNLTGAELPLDRPIEYVSVNDLPLDDFIRKNEMVISIATPYVERDELMTEFIEGLIKAHASIFILAIPSDNMALSEKNIEIAKAGNLPILQIPWDVRFADICETVLHRLHVDYDKAIERINALQTDLLNCFLNGRDIKAATSILSVHLNCNVAIRDSHDHIVSGNPTLKSQSVIPLEVSGYLYGNLYLDAEKTQKESTLLRHTLSPLMPLWFYKNELIENTQLMAKDEFIWGLANGTDVASETTQRTARLMDLHINRIYTCIVCHPFFSNSVSEEWQSNWIYAKMDVIRKAFINAANEMRREILITQQNNALIVYFEVVPSLGKQQIVKYLDLVESKLQSLSKNLSFAWGISEIKDAPTDYRNYYLHAKLAVALCTNDTRLRKRFFYENTLIYNIMSTLSSDEDFIKSTYDILSPIIEYDKSKKTKLMDTLRVYLTCKSVSETSRKLKRHRQTLLYQLEKIEDLTGFSLKNNDELFLLEVCMRLQMDFSNIEEPVKKSL